MNQMMNQVNAYAVQKYFKVTNHGWYVAHFEVQYTFEGEVYNVESGSFSLGIEKKIFVPETATDVTIKISSATGVNWTNIESKFSKTMQTTCFMLHGTLFTPYALEVNCTAQSEIETPNPNPNPCCCCCCNCSGACQSGMSMEEYMEYLKKLYEQNNM